MTPQEVALELMKILIPAKDPMRSETREELLALYRQCLKTVREEP